MCEGRAAQADLILLLSTGEHSIELPKGTRSQGVNLNMYTLSTPTKTTVKALTSPVRIPVFIHPPSSSGAVLYDQTMMSRVLEEAQLEAPASSSSPIDDKGRTSLKIACRISGTCTCRSSTEADAQSISREATSPRGNTQKKLAQNKFFGPAA